MIRFCKSDSDDPRLNDLLCALQTREMRDVHFGSRGADSELCALQDRVAFRVNRSDAVSVNDFTANVVTVDIPGNAPIVSRSDRPFVANDDRADLSSIAGRARGDHLCHVHKIFVPRFPHGFTPVQGVIRFIMDRLVEPRKSQARSVVAS